VTSLVGSLTRLALAPSLADVSFAGRGFPVTPSDATRRLEAVPQSVVCGFEWGIDTRDNAELETRLDLVEPEMRGFAYEGAVMARTILDALPGKGGRTRTLLLGGARKHVFLAYIGIGFAMSHLPRPLWKGVLPDAPGLPYHPTMSWLAVDGYGFDQAYFHTDTFVHRQRPLAPYPWLGEPAYFPRAADQGIGRALWFMHGGNVVDVATAVHRFAAGRRADLWSGVGLAATFAGGCSGADLIALRRTAAAEDPEYALHLSLGSTFAARARTFAGFVPEHTATAIQALTGLTVDAVTTLAETTEPSGGVAVGQRYEAWRTAIREQLDRHPAGAPGR